MVTGKPSFHCGPNVVLGILGFLLQAGVLVGQHGAAPSSGVVTARRGWPLSQFNWRSGASRPLARTTQPSDAFLAVSVHTIRRSGRSCFRKVPVWWTIQPTSIPSATQSYAAISLERTANLARRTRMQRSLLAWSRTAP
jgi:hypothetical protein